MQSLLEFIKALDPAKVAIIAAAIGAVATIISGLIAAIIGKLIVAPFLGARDKQDREGEWRKHAIELTKLDLDRMLKTRHPTDTSRLRPSILDFLANYRDLQELGAKSPKELYLKIEADRINPPVLESESQCGKKNSDPPRKLVKDFSPMACFALLLVFLTYSHFRTSAISSNRRPRF